jgi:hypothetical protein
LEEAAVALASVAVRIAMSISQTGAASPQRASQPPALCSQMNALAGEVGKAARVFGAARRDDLHETRVGACLGASLRAALSAEMIELGPATGTDRCLQAEALLSLRARWVELAAGLWGIAESLDDLLEIVTFEHEERMRRAVGLRASRALAASRLSDRPADFDHWQAWERHREALCELAGEVCLAVDSREPDTVVRTQQHALRRLARALAAIWTIDERMRKPTPRTTTPWL